jgi:hypothetical protein
MLRAACFAVLAVALSSTPAAAQDPLLVSHTLTPPEMLAESQRDAFFVPPANYFVLVEPEPRPAALVSLYAMQGVLQGLDAYTTLKGLSKGHRELNPLLKGGNPTLIVGAKIAAASLNVLVVEKMWRKNRKGAVLTMIATNLLMSAVVIHNSRVMAR